jgi:hypothetical protein
MRQHVIPAPAHRCPKLELTRRNQAWFDLILSVTRFRKQDG